MKIVFKDLLIDWNYTRVENNGITPSYLTKWEVYLNNSLPDLGFNSGLSAPKIDYLEGF